MAVNLILLDDVTDLGKIGDQVHVSDGYARNYLLPKKLAAVVTPAILKQIEKRKAIIAKVREERIAAAKVIAEQIAKLNITIMVAAGEDDKLYGAVTAAQLVDAAKEQGVTLERNQLVLDKPIRELGSREVEVKLDADVRGLLKVKVVRKEGAQA